MPRDHSELPPKLEDYVESCSKSSDRGRFVVIAINLASILVFFSYWNALQTSWNRHRERAIGDALAYFEAIVDPVGGQAADLAAGAGAAGSSPTPAQAREGLGPDRYHLVRSYLLRYMGLDPGVYPDDGKVPVPHSVARARRSALETRHAEILHIQQDRIVTVTVPFIGVVFDVNDLGVFGGITFLALLMWLRFSLARESINLRLLFDEARTIDRDEKQRDGKHEPYLRWVYNVLAARQVLTSPQIEGDRNPAIWRWASRMLYCMPLLLQGAVLANDIDTAYLGFAVDSASTVTVLLIAGSLLSALAFLTYHCFTQDLQIDQLWSGAYSEIQAWQVRRSEAAAS